MYEVKLGAENRKKAIIAAVLLPIALIAVGYQLMGSFSSPPAPAAAAQPEPAAAPAIRPARGKGVAGKRAVAPRSLDPTLRYDWLRESEDTKYTGTGRNIFSIVADIPKPVAPAIIKQQQEDAAKQAQLPPPPPPINLKFFGFASKPGEPKKIFLSQGEDVFIASEGQIVDRRYKVVRISPVSVEIEDVLYNHKQSIPLTQS